MTARPPPRSTPPVRPRVLFVDDEPMLLQSLAATFRRRFDVTTATDPMVALELLARDGGFPVVVSDYRMPEMDGETFLIQVRERFPLTMRILLTGAGIESDDIAASKPGLVFRLLTKPCRRDVLIGVIEEALAAAAAAAAATA